MIGESKTSTVNLTMFDQPDDQFAPAGSVVTSLP